ncbi:quinone oxidoreductase family protein [Bryobacter aggregatus]|uniref:quinone oxidoreductase family protein n=1 Tax=Bryobacter aggregatus TaxID=360054 RepID=UPI0004E16B05|nr:quinone oxidoreductase [Bryobacter aggregatus]
MKAILIHQTGGPEQLQLGETALPKLGPKQVLVKIAVSGVNFIDTYHRTGLYHQPTPFIPGMEAAGTIEALGEEVSGLQVGQRVAYAMNIGSYAEYAVIPAWQAVPVPDAVSLENAAAVMLQGMTAHYLSHSTWKLEAGQTCVVHACSGGVGLILTQLAKKIGAKVIGTTSAQPGSVKYELAQKAGADEIYSYENFKPKGVDVVYDGVGAATFQAGLNALRPRGMMVTFGNASGPVPDVSPLVLSQKGSLFLTRPTLAHYAATRDELLWRSGDLFRWIADGSLWLHIEKIYPMAEAAEAHRDLESRKTSGKLLLKN